MSLTVILTQNVGHTSETKANVLLENGNNLQYVNVYLGYQYGILGSFFRFRSEWFHLIPARSVPIPDYDQVQHGTIQVLTPFHFNSYSIQNCFLLNN